MATPKKKRRDDRGRPYALYIVKQFEENKHAETVFIGCTNGSMFAVHTSGFCSPGETILASWGGDDKLVGLYKADVEGGKVRVGRCIKGAASTSALVPLSSVSDLR